MKMILRILILAFAVAACFADVTVILGGETDGLLSASVATVETFSPNCGIFKSNIPPLPKPRRQAAAAYLDGKIYLCGGYSALTEIKTCYVLDLSQETYEWTESAELIAGRFKFEMVVAGSKIYAVGGEGSFSAHDNIEIYDPSTNTWTEGPSLTGFRQGFCAVATEESIYIAGGFDQNNLRRRVEKLDLSTLEWSQLANLPDNKTSHACALYKDGFVAVGGWTGTGEEIGDIYPTNTIEYYDFETDTWSSVSHMSHRRSEVVMSNVDDTLVVFGGYQGSHLDTYEFFNATSAEELEGFWTYGKERMEEYKSNMGIVVVPSGMIDEC